MTLRAAAPLIAGFLIIGLTSVVCGKLWDAPYTQGIGVGWLSAAVTLVLVTGTGLVSGSGRGSSSAKVER